MPQSRKVRTDDCIGRRIEVLAAIEHLKGQFELRHLISAAEQRLRGKIHEQLRELGRLLRNFL